MFEESLMESAGQIRPNSKWMIAGSMLLQTLAMSALLLVPIFYPEALPRQTIASLLVAPPESHPPAAQRQPRPATGARPRIAVLNLSTATARTTPPASISDDDGGPQATNGWEPDAAQVGVQDGMPDLSALVPISTAKPTVKGPVRVSSGVAAGLLLSPIHPIYPAIARASHVQGTVVVAATISRQGTIENVRVVAGPLLLQDAAVKAIRAARYKPFLLNGAPVEVETTINIVFALGG